jgi:SAM-dependent methyltransferase
MSVLRNSWSAFSASIAGRYLKTYGHPSFSSKEMVADILLEQRGTAPFSILDLGCGNGHMYEYFVERGLQCHYTGVDFSDTLLAAARAAIGGDERVRLVQDDIGSLASIDGHYDVVLYSHTLEMLESPDQSLRRARDLGTIVMIRFFEPPDFEDDTTELREMEVGDGSRVPYLRRKMGRDYYRLILHKIGCETLDLYRDPSAKDQIHVLHFRG